MTLDVTCAQGPSQYNNCVQDFEIARFPTDISAEAGYGFKLSLRRVHETST